MSDNYRQAEGLSAAVVAIAWALRQTAITGVIVGARRPGQLDELIPAETFRLDAAEVAEIAGFLPDGTGANVMAAS